MAPEAHMQHMQSELGPDIPVKTLADELNELPARIEKLEAWMATGRQEYIKREADKVLNVLAARGIHYIVFKQGRLAYLYDSGREVPVGCFGYHRVTKEQALADWLAYVHAAMPAEVEWMEQRGYTSDVRECLESSPEYDCMLNIDTEYACDPGRIDRAYKVLGLQGDPVWEILKAKAVQFVQWEETLKKKSIRKCGKALRGAICR